MPVNNTRTTAQDRRHKRGDTDSGGNNCGGIGYSGGSGSSGGGGGSGSGCCNGGCRGGGSRGIVGGACSDEEKIGASPHTTEVLDAEDLGFLSSVESVGLAPVRFASPHPIERGQSPPAVAVVIAAAVAPVVVVPPRFAAPTVACRRCFVAGGEGRGGADENEKKNERKKKYREKEERMLSLATAAVASRSRRCTLAGSRRQSKLEAAVAQNPNIGWEEFRAAIMRRFEDSRFADFNVQLKTLMQNGSEIDYQHQFESMSCLVTSWEDEALVGVFIGGLQPEIQLAVLGQPSRDLQECMRVARHKEEKIRRKQALQKSYKEIHKEKRYYGKPPSPKAIKPSSGKTHEGRPAFQETVPDDNHLPDTSSGEVEVDTTSEKPESPSGGCHTIADPNHPKAMRVIGTIQTKEVTVLLDSGATHNYMKTEVAQTLGCTLAPHRPLTVVVGNGS
ncbi:hypothetical protein EJ110_NYTH39984 [Nymphaea thermarum]|nr:hypothetical protein EJ110_NYTH39984 [Nymphaea thermarum]